MLVHVSRFVKPQMANRLGSQMNKIAIDLHDDRGQPDFDELAAKV